MSVKMVLKPNTVFLIDNASLFRQIIYLRHTYAQFNRSSEVINYRQFPDIMWRSCLTWVDKNKKEMSFCLGFNLSLMLLNCPFLRPAIRQFSCEIIVEGKLMILPSHVFTSAKYCKECIIA